MGLSGKHMGHGFPWIHSNRPHLAFGGGFHFEILTLFTLKTEGKTWGCTLAFAKKALLKLMSTGISESGNALAADLYINSQQSVYGLDPAD